ncbi:hypothetical protein [Flagellimonas pacifica]|nr:hypothetical protein [Allomuricauda parva]
MRYAIIIILSMHVLNICAQDNMFIGQLSKRMVVRENYDENGVFLNKQKFESGEVENMDGYYEIEVVTELYDEEEKLTDTYTTTYRCRPKESSIMVMAFPFAEPKSKKTEINSNSKNFKELYDLGNLEEIELEISFDSGLLDFFGSKSKIRIFDRVLESDENAREIKSKINIRTYALGIRIKSFNYEVLEKLTEKDLLSFQKFTEEDGSYFTMTYK